MSQGEHKSRSFEANKSEKGILLDVGTNEVEFLEFEVADQRYAVNVAKVHQVLPFEGLLCQKIPHQVEGTIGSVLYREQQVTAYDLRTLLSLQGPEAATHRKILLIMFFNKNTYGFLVDKVVGIERVSWTQFTPMSCEQVFKAESSVIGTIKVDERLIISIDFEAIMSQLDPAHSVEAYGGQVSKDIVDRSNINLLYCEDSPTVRRVSLNVLRQAGFTQLHVVPTGVEGLKYLQSEAGKKVDIILTDIEMPEMDGLTLCKNVKSVAETAHVPVIFFSSLISEQMKLKCESVNGDACFSKPEINLAVLEIDSLYRKIKAEKQRHSGAD